MTKISPSFFFLVLSVISFSGMGQAPIGGENVAEMLNNPFSARVQALGGINLTLHGSDASLGYSNPAAWNTDMHKTVVFGTQFLPGFSNAGNVQYTHHFDKRATFGFGMLYQTYGNMLRTDEAGNEIGKFTANDFAWFSGTAYHFAKMLSVGANAKLFYSQIDNFHSMGMAADIAFSVNDTARHLSATLAATNIGYQFLAFRKGNNELMPFDLRLGFAFGFKGFPLKFHVTVHNLHRWNISYNNPADDAGANLFQNNQTVKKKNWGDEIFRHFIIGTEANIKKVVRLQLAYNHQRRQELRQVNVRGIAGISFGLGIHIRYFDVQYALNPAALGRTTNHLTFALNIAKLPKRKKV